MARLAPFVVMLLMLSVVAVAEINCPDVINQLFPCVGYIEGHAGNKPSGGCCDGVKKIYSLATQQSDRADICKCLQPELLRRRNSLVADNVIGLTDACGVPFQMPPMDPNYNCSTIS